MVSLVSYFNSWLLVGSRAKKVTFVATGKVPFYRQGRDALLEKVTN